MVVMQSLSRLPDISHRVQELPRLLRHLSVQPVKLFHGESRFTELYNTSKVSKCSARTGMATTKEAASSKGALAPKLVLLKSGLVLPHLQPRARRRLPRRIGYLPGPWAWMAWHWPSYVS
jgi:hypothetical protein